MNKEFDPRRLDVRKFAQAAAELASDEPLSGYRRLMEETQGRGGQARVAWTARGELVNPAHYLPQVWLHLQAGTRLALVCQRCLQPVDIGVNVARSFRFVPDEATAAAQDDTSEEDVLAASRSFDLLQLVEDELLMELPLAPRHERCPVTLPMAVGEQELAAAAPLRENPFAALGRLRRPKH